MTKTFLLVAAVSAAAVVAQSRVGSMPTTMSHQDTSFVKDAYEGGMDEVKLGELALQNASSDRVKKFGQRMIDDHTRLNNDVQSLAASKNVTLPSNIGIMDKASYKMLAAKHDANFDKSYISDMMKDHESDIAAFRKEINSGTDGDVKAAAQKALPTLEEHLRMAQDIARELGIPVK